LLREGEFAGSVGLDQSPDHHSSYGRTGDAGMLPIRFAGDAEQQDAFGDAERGGLDLFHVRSNRAALEGAFPFAPG
jgi:hypothetical protein